MTSSESDTKVGGPLWKYIFASYKFGCHPLNRTANKRNFQAKLCAGIDTN